MLPSFALFSLSILPVQADAPPADDPQELLGELMAAEPEGPPAASRYPVAETIERFEKRLAERPGDVNTLSLLGGLYLRNAKENDALEYYEKAVKTLRAVADARPDNPGAKVALATALNAVHQFAEARELAAAAFAADGSAEALAVRSDAELGLGDYETAFKSIDDLQVLAGPKPAALIRAARAEELQGDLTQAIALAEGAYRKLEAAGWSHETLAWHAWRVGELRRLAGDFDAAAEAYERAHRHDPAFEPALEGHAQLAIHRGNLPEAIERYEAIVEAGGGPPVVATLGDLYDLAGRDDDAEAMIDRAEAEMREEAKVAAAVHYSEFADFLISHNRHEDEAVALAAADMKQRGDYQTRSTYAWCLFKAGRVEEAAEAIRPAVALNVIDPQMRLRAGTILAAEDPDLAVEQLERALAHDHLLGPAERDAAVARLTATRRRD